MLEDSYFENEDSYEQEPSTFPMADGDAAELNYWLEEIERQNMIRESHGLEPMDIDSCRHRVAEYIVARQEADKKLAARASELGRPLKMAESIEIEGRVVQMFRSLKRDLTYAAAGFSGGLSEVFSVADEYDLLLKEAAGELAPGYEALKEKMSSLSPEERQALIDELYDGGRINDYQRDQLLHMFVENAYSCYQKINTETSEEGDDMEQELINPETCPFRSTVDGLPVCTFRLEKDKQPDDEDHEETESYNSGSGRDDQETREYEPGEPEISHEFSVDGKEVDVSDPPDVDFSDDSIGCDFDFDPGDYGDSNGNGSSDN